MSRNGPRGGLLWPFLLVGLGLIFLLNNLGVTTISVWDLLVRYWPLLLIAGGIDILFLRSSVWGSLLAGVLILVILVGGVFLLEVRPLPEAELETIRQSGRGVDRAEVVLNPAVGSIRLSVPGSGSQDLIRGQVARGYGERLAQAFDAERDPPRFELRHEGWRMFPLLQGWGSGWTWDLMLNAQVEIVLNVDVGVGRMDLDLRGMSLDRLEASLGVGQIVVTLPESGQFTARVEGGVGDSMVVIPAGMEARIRLDTALVQVNIPDGYIEVGENTFVSPGFDEAENKVDLEVGQAIGSVRIR
jgi:hypothetical protein